MRGHLHADDGSRWHVANGVHDGPPDLPPLKLRPRWLVVLTKHLAPRAHERYLLQGIELSEEELARIRAMPRRRPWWVAFLRRHLPLRDG
jgi:hypothetical protein